MGRYGLDHQAAFSDECSTDYSVQTVEMEVNTKSRVVEISEVEKT